MAGGVARHPQPEAAPPGISRHPHMAGRLEAPWRRLWAQTLLVGAQRVLAARRARASVVRPRVDDVAGIRINLASPPTRRAPTSDFATACTAVAKSGRTPGRRQEAEAAVARTTPQTRFSPESRAASRRAQSPSCLGKSPFGRSGVKAALGVRKPGGSPWRRCGARSTCSSCTSSNVLRLRLTDDQGWRLPAGWSGQRSELVCHAARRCRRPPRLLPRQVGPSPAVYFARRLAQREVRGDR
jgi:hypothetical protein